MNRRALSIKHAGLAEDAIETSLAYSRVIYVAERGVLGACLVRGRQLSSNGHSTTHRRLKPQGEEQLPGSDRGADSNRQS